MGDSDKHKTFLSLAKIEEEAGNFYLSRLYMQSASTPPGLLTQHNVRDNYVQQNI